MNNSSGNILLSVSIVLFIIAIATTSGVWYLAHKKTAGPDPTTTTQPSPPLTNNPLLEPTITIASDITDQADTIQAKLTTPLRQYYATQPEHLAAIDIASSGTAEMPITVTVTTITPAGAEMSVSFLYDLSAWTPDMLNNQPDDTSATDE